MASPSIRQEVSELREQVTRLTANVSSLVDQFREERQEAQRDREEIRREIKDIADGAARRREIPWELVISSGLQAVQQITSWNRNQKHDRKTNASIMIAGFTALAVFFGWAVISPRDNKFDKLEGRVEKLEMVNGQQDTLIDGLDKKCTTLRNEGNTTRSVFWSQLNQLLTRLGFPAIDDPLGWQN